MALTPSHYLFQEFEIIKQGSQGMILKATDDKNQDFAMKVLNLDENNNLNVDVEYKKQKKEADIMRILSGIKGIPEMLYFGKDKYLNRNVLVEELLGSDLTSFKNKQNKFSLKTSLKIFYILLNILKEVHAKNIIHRDIKPDNIMLSRDFQEVYIVDFGLGKNLSKKKEKKSNFKEKTFVGNLRYCGLNAHKFKNDTKQDDLISIGFLFYDLLFGNLPWSNCEGKSFLERNKIIEGMKKNLILLESKKFSKFYFNYFKHIIDAKNDKKVNYKYLLEMIILIAKENDIDLNDIEWDWNNEVELMSPILKGTIRKDMKDILNEERNSNFSKKLINLQRACSTEGFFIFVY